MSLKDYLLSDDFIAGSIAGSIGIVATQPLDTLRIRCQLNKSMNMRGHAISTMRQEGLRGLFRGVASPTLTVGLMSAVLFQSFESSRSVIAQLKYNYYGHACESSYTDLAIAGCVAGTITSFITSPTELFKILVQENTSSESATLRQEFREGYHLWQRYGLSSGVFRGLNVTILRDAPAFAVYFPCYEVFVNKFDPYRATQMVPFIGGGLAGMLSWAAVYPMDHIKTLYQTRQLSYGILPLRQAIAHHLRMEGGSWLSLYKGMCPTLLRCTPQHAVVFVCYEEVKKAMNAKMEEEEEEIMRIALPNHIATTPIHRHMHVHSAADVGEMISMNPVANPW